MTWISRFVFTVTVLLTSINLDAQRRVIVIWCTDKEVAGIMPIAKSFKKKQQISVDIIIQADPRSNYISAVKTGTGPDILVGAHDWVGELAKNGTIAELTLTQSEKDRFYPKAIRGFTYNNKLYGIPYDYEALVMYYNKKMISRIPSSWEELIHAAKKLTVSGKYGFLYGIGRDFYRNYPFMGAYQALIFPEKDGFYNIRELGLDSPGALDGCRFIQRLVEEGIVPRAISSGTVESLFYEGRAAMVMDGCWNYRDYLRVLGDNLGVARLPSLNGNPSRSYTGSRGFMVNNASRQISHARNFVINFTGSVEAQLAMYRHGGRPPGNIEAARQVMSENPHIKTMIESAEDGILMPNIKAMALVFNYASNAIDRFNTGEISVEDAMKQVSDRIRNDLINKQSRYE